MKNSTIKNFRGGEFYTAPLIDLYEAPIEGGFLPSGIDGFSEGDGTVQDDTKAWE